MTSTGERIKKVRKFIGLTQKDFADSLGITQANISAIEKNISNPSLTLVKLICIQYQINEEWILKGKGDMSVRLAEYTTENTSGMLTKLQNMKILFDEIIKNSQENKEILYYIEEGFAFFVSILSSSNLKEQCRLLYLKEIYTFMDELEKYTFECSTMYPQKRLDTDKILHLREHQIELQSKLQNTLNNITNIYIDNARKD